MDLSNLFDKFYRIRKISLTDASIDLSEYLLFIIDSIFIIERKLLICVINIYDKIAVHSFISYEYCRVELFSIYKVIFYEYSYTIFVR